MNIRKAKYWEFHDQLNQLIGFMAGSLFTIVPPFILWPIFATLVLHYNLVMVGWGNKPVGLFSSVAIGLMSGVLFWVIIFL